MSNAKFSRRCPGPEVRKEQWNALQRRRVATTARLREYLSEEACVAGVPVDVTGLNPYADQLGQAFLSLVKCEMAGHSDALESLRCMRAIAVVLSEMLRIIPKSVSPALARDDDYSLLLDEQRSARLRINDLEEFNSRASHIRVTDPSYSETMALAELLAKAYPKACAEYERSLEAGDVPSCIHHAAIVADQFSEMLDVLQYMKLRDERDFTEYAVPELHDTLQAE